MSQESVKWCPPVWMRWHIDRDRARSKGHVTEGEEGHYRTWMRMVDRDRLLAKRAAVGIESSVTAIDSELGSRGLIRRRGWLVIGSVICCWTQTVGPLLSRACPSWRGVTTDHSIAPAIYFFFFFFVHHPLRTCFLWPWFFFSTFVLFWHRRVLTKCHCLHRSPRRPAFESSPSEGSRIFCIPLQLFIVLFQVGRGCLDVTWHRKRLIKSRWLRLWQTQKVTQTNGILNFPQCYLMLKGVCIFWLEYLCTVGCTKQQGQTNRESLAFRLECSV